MGNTYKEKNMYLGLGAEQILDAKKRVHDMYPLANAPVEALFPVLGRCSCLWKSKKKGNQITDLESDSIASELSDLEEARRKNQTTVQSTNPLQEDQPLEITPRKR